MNLVERIKGILLQPKLEWPVIECEPGNAGYLFSNYVAIVAAAIPAVCTFMVRQLSVTDRIVSASASEFYVPS
jgi:hypothetical protein